MEWQRVARVREIGEQAEQVLHVGLGQVDARPVRMIGERQRGRGGAFASHLAKKAQVVLAQREQIDEECGPCGMETRQSGALVVRQNAVEKREQAREVLERLVVHERLERTRRLDLPVVEGERTPAHVLVAHSTHRVGANGERHHARLARAQRLQAQQVASVQVVDDRNVVRADRGCCCC